MSDPSTLLGFHWLSYWLIHTEAGSPASCEVTRLLMERAIGQLRCSGGRWKAGSFTDPHHPHPHCTGAGSDDGGEAADRQFGRDEAREADRRWKMGIK